MLKNGENLQRLIRTIEGARAAGKEIAVESPKYLVDRVTGEQREHDVVLTIKHAHHELIVALECRDRSRKVGVPEIEAFQNKCRDTGIHSGIIVSSKGFYQTAKKKAKAYGIRCLSLDELNGLDWFLPAEMQIISTHLKHVHTQINFEQKFGISAVDIVDFEGRPISSEGVNQTALNALTEHRDLLPKEIGEHVIRVDVEPDFYATVDGIPRKAVEVYLTVTYEIRCTSTPFQFKAYNDQDSGKAIAQAAIATMDVGNLRADLIASTAEDGSINVAIVPAQKSMKRPI
jgi:hypothetical protein